MPAKKTLQDYEREAQRLRNGCLEHPTRYASRRVYKMRHGPLSPERMVLHKCDNPYCIADEHLFVGSQLDNMRDAAAKGRGINQNLAPELLTRRGAAVSKALKGKTLSEATKVKIGLANTGKVMSEESRAKIAATKIGIANPMYGKFGPAHSRYGKKMSEETKTKLRAAWVRRKERQAWPSTP